MYKHYLRTFCVALVVLFSFLSCKKDGAGGSGSTSSTVYQELLEIYNKGICFVDAEQTAAVTKLNFDDGSSLSVNRSDLEIYNCVLSDPPSVRIHYGRNVWIVNEVETDIPVTPDATLYQSVPVCVYYDSETLYIRVSNNDILRIENRRDKSLISFEFLAEDNLSLKSDLSCIIMGGKITGVFPENITQYVLKPSFTFRGKRMTVNGIEQISGESEQDFSRPIEYVLELLDGTTITYTVDIERPLRFPTVYIHTDNNAPILDKENYVPGTIRIEDPDCRYSNTPVYESRMGIRGRGNSTWGMPKKPWKVKLDEKMRIFDISKDKEWALLANYADKTLLRNVVAMEISRICEMKWTPAMRSVDVYLNNEYQGCYTWTEHKKISDERVNIDVVGKNDNEGEALTGGYYFEIEQQMDETTCFMTGQGVPIMFSDPEEPTSAQLAYVKQYFQDFENALFGNNFTNPQEGYAKYIDVPSFINYYIIQELTKNIDGNLRKSSFLTKERGKKLEMYHVWDFDLTLGNCDYFPSMYPGVDNSATGWFIKNCSLQGVNSGWFYRMFQDPNFVRELKVRWNSLKAQLRTIPDFIDMNAQLIDGSQERNFVRWPILDEYVWPNAVVLGDYHKEVQYMKQFYLDRLEWLDGAINSL